MRYRNLFLYFFIIYISIYNSITNLWDAVASLLTVWCCWALQWGTFKLLKEICSQSGIWKGWFNPTDDNSTESAERPVLSRHCIALPAAHLKSFWFSHLSQQDLKHEHWSNISYRWWHFNVTVSNINISHLPPFKHGQDAPNVHAYSPQQLLGQVTKPVLRCSCPSLLLLMLFLPVLTEFIVHPKERSQKQKRECWILLRCPGRHLHSSAFI